MNLKDLFLGLQHVGLPTNRYEETISFYHRIGFETYDTEINGASRVCFLRLNVRRYADCANIAAALSITRRGGIPSMPRREEIVGTILQMNGDKRLYEA